MNNNLRDMPTLAAGVGAAMPTSAAPKPSGSRITIPALSGNEPQDPGVGSRPIERPGQVPIATASPSAVGVPKGNKIQGLWKQSGVPELPQKNRILGIPGTGAARSLYAGAQAPLGSMNQYLHNLGVRERANPSVFDKALTVGLRPGRWAVQTAFEYGSPNPLAPYASVAKQIRETLAAPGTAKEKAKGVGSAMSNLAINVAFLAGGMANGASVMNEPETRLAIGDMFKEKYDLAEEDISGVTDAYIAGSTGLDSIIPMFGAGAQQDLTIDAEFAAAGAAVGTVIGGPGPGTAAGLGAGWVVGRFVSGAMNMYQMMSPLFTSVFGDSAAMPIMPKFWILGQEIDLFPFRELTADAPVESMMSSMHGGYVKVAEYLNAKYPDRYVSPVDADREGERIWNNYYESDQAISNGEYNPRNEEIGKLITNGYFVGKDAYGNWGIDKDMLRTYQLQTASFRLDADKKKYLPPLTTYSKEFSTFIRAKGWEQEFWNELMTNVIWVDEMHNQTP